MPLQVDEGDDLLPPDVIEILLHVPLVDYVPACVMRSAAGEADNHTSWLKYQVHETEIWFAKSECFLEICKYMSVVSQKTWIILMGEKRKIFFCFDPAFKVTYIGCPVLDLNYKVYFIYLVVCLTTFTCIFTKTDNWKNKIIIIKYN